METLIGLMIAGGVAYWVYTDAKKRESSHPILWSLGVLLLLIVFLPLYLIFRPKKKEIQPLHSSSIIQTTKITSSQEQKFEEHHTNNCCPKCGNKVEVNAHFCQYCGTSIVNDAIKSHYCPSCGCSIDSVVRFCPHCGMDLSKDF